MDVPLARLAQCLERCRVSAALRQAVAAVAEGVRVAAEPPLAQRRVVGERERRAQVGAHVVADGERVDVVLADAVEHAAGLLGALGRVLGQIAGDPAALLRVAERRTSSSSPQLTRPPPSSSGSGACTACAVARIGVLEQLDVEPAGWRVELVGAVGRASPGLGG